MATPDSTNNSPLLSTAQQLRDFQESAVWHDIRTFLEMRIADHGKMLEQVSPVESSAIARSQGIIANARDLIDLPEMLVAELLAMSEEERLG